MCARYGRTEEGFTFQIGQYVVTITMGAQYNIAPTRLAAIIVPDATTGILGIPAKFGWNDGRMIVNAKAETLLEKTYWQQRTTSRCLIPANCFYEFTVLHGKKIPIRFTQKDEKPFLMAGLRFQSVDEPKDNSVLTDHFVILTTFPNSTVGEFHDRMPFILKPYQYEGWLFGDEYKNVLLSPDRDELGATAVNPDLNDPKKEGKELIKPYTRDPELF